MVYLVECPNENCKQLILIEAINCGIFRHAVYKTGSELNPHSSKELCLSLLSKNELYGCGQPFRVRVEGDGTLVEKCDYI